MDNTLIQGDVTELQCVLSFQKRGYYCSIPFSGSCRYDVVVDINNKLYRIQCKSSKFHEEDGTLRMSATRSTTNTQKTTRYQYTKDEIDFFYTFWNGYEFLIPVEEVSTEKYLRIKKPKYVQVSMSIGSDYLLDNVLKAIINNQPIEKYRNNMIISYSEKEEEKLWSDEELNKKYEERQIRYIKECISKNKTAYGLSWKYKEFPEL